MTAAHTLRLVLGDQLHPGHSWFSQVDEQVVYVLMEVRQDDLPPSAMPMIW